MLDSKVIRTRYLNETFSQYSNESLNTREKFWENVSTIEEQIGKFLEERYTRDEFIKVFTMLNVRLIGTFYVQKNIIVKYLYWLHDNQIVNNDLNIEELSDIAFEDIEFSDLVKGTYFKDFESLQKEIDKTVDRAGKPDNAVHDAAITLIYLAWYGVTAEDACKIRKSDINQINGEIYIERTGKPVIVSREAIDLISDYRDATYYTSQARYLIKMPYKTSKLLLRTPKAPELTAINLRNTLSRFNIYCMGDIKFLYSSIRLSGIFNRAFAEELVNGTLVKSDYDKLSEVFGETFKTYHDASDRLREYKSWKAMFHQQRE